MDNKEYQERIHYEELTKMLMDFYQEKPLLDTAKLIEKIKLVEEFSLDRRRIFCLFSNVDFYFKYISENVKKELGYSAQDIYEGGLLLGFKMIYWKQIPMAVKVHQWGERFQKIVKHPANISKRAVFYCGVKTKDAQGRLRTFFIKQKMLSYTKENKPLLSFLEVEEITTIFKGDFIWARMTADYKKVDYVRVFFSKGKKKEYADLLSERELEILRLIIQHKSSLEISKILAITKSTVEKHRKNMIAKAGVIDMSGLIYVCRLCQLI